MSAAETNGEFGDAPDAEHPRGLHSHARFLQFAHEFCFFSPDQWVAELRRDRFDVDVHRIRHPWLIEHRFAPAATVTQADGVSPDPWSWTNVLLVARKSEA